MNGIAKFLRAAYLPAFLIPLGIILTVFGVLFYNNVNTIKNYPKTEAVVSRTELFQEAYTDAEGDRTEATYTVYVNYTVDGTEYTDIEYGVFSGYTVGERVTICYNPDDPRDIAQPNGIIIPIIMLAGGIAAFIGGIATSVLAVKKHKRLKEQEKEWTNGN